MAAYYLKWIAVLTMVTDHLGAAFFPQVPVLRIIGRISFPIFAFLLCEGFCHTRSVKKYGMRLLVFAVVSELPFQFFSYGLFFSEYAGFYNQNVMFELVLVLGALYCLRRGGWFLLGSAGAVILAQFGGFMYGGYGVLLALCFYVFRDKKWAMLLSVAIMAVLYCLVYRQLSVQIWSVLAIVPLCFYNGEKGLGFPKYVFYGFYPAHLLLLGVVRYFLPS